MTTPTNLLRMALDRVEFSVYTKYVLHCFPMATHLEGKSNSGFVLKKDAKILLSTSGAWSNNFFCVEGFAEIVEKRKGASVGWYERVLKEAQTDLLDGLGIPHDASLAALCICCDELLNRLTAEELPLELQGITEFELGEFDEKVVRAMRDLFEAPFPEPGYLSLWLNGGEL